MSAVSCTKVSNLATVAAKAFVWQTVAGPTPLDGTTVSCVGLSPEIFAWLDYRLSFCTLFGQDTARRQKANIVGSAHSLSYVGCVGRNTPNSWLRNFSVHTPRRFQSKKGEDQSVSEPGQQCGASCLVSVPPGRDSARTQSCSVFLFVWGRGLVRSYYFWQIVPLDIPLESLTLVSGSSLPRIGAGLLAGRLTAHV